MDQDADPAAARGGDAAAQPGRDGRRFGDACTAAADPPSGTRKTWQVSNGSPSSAAPTAPSVPAPPSRRRPLHRRPRSSICQERADAGDGARPGGRRRSRSTSRARPAGRGRAPIAKAPVRPVLSPVPLRPSPAPARQGVTTTPAPAPAAAPEEEEAASWDKLVTDTADPSAQLDTAPKSSGRSGSAALRRLASRALPPPPVSSRRLWIVVGAATAGVVILIIVGVIIAIASSAGPNQRPRTDSRRSQRRRYVPHPEEAPSQHAIRTITSSWQGTFKRTRSPSPRSRT